MVEMTKRLLQLLAMAMAMAAVATEAQLLTREDLAPLLRKKVVIPETPHATPWPAEFTIRFTTDGGLAPGLLAYDWERQQQAIVHAGASSHCRARGSAPGGECIIIENARGTFEVDFEKRRCELTKPGVRTVAPDWTTRGVFAGAEDVAGVQCNRFEFPPSPHAWLETVDGGLPCEFVFPVANMSYLFDPRSFTTGKPQVDFFTVPEFCPREEIADQYWV